MTNQNETYEECNCECEELNYKPRQKEKTNYKSGVFYIGLLAFVLLLFLFAFIVFADVTAAAIISLLGIGVTAR